MRVALCLALIFVSVPAFAQDSTVPTPQPQAASAGATSETAKPKREKRICRSQSDDSAVSTGSIMGAKQICHTKAQWEALAPHVSHDTPNRDNLTSS